MHHGREAMVAGIAPCVVAKVATQVVHILEKQRPQEPEEDSPLTPTPSDSFLAPKVP